LVALTTSSAVYALIGTAILVLGAATNRLMTPEPTPMDVTFIETVARPEAAVLAPAPPVEQKAIAQPRRRAAAAAPAIPKRMKTRELAAPPPERELVAPSAVPKEPPKEADVREDKGVAVYGGDANTDPAGLEGSRGQGAGSLVGELPPGTSPPKPWARNPQPEYPRSARMSRRIGSVVLQCTVRADGTVDDLKVLRGEEPFVTAAVKAVRRWRYEPAMRDGHPVAVPHKIEVRFELDT
jgi:protein TonB